MDGKILIYILVMATVTYLIRVLPFVFFRKEITNKFVRSFLYYVPYVTLSAMTFPAILYSASEIWVGLSALVVAVALALLNRSLFTVSAAACFAAFATEVVLWLIK